MTGPPPAPPLVVVITTGLGLIVVVDEGTLTVVVVDEGLVGEALGVPGVVTEVVVELCPEGEVDWVEDPEVIMTSQKSPVNIGGHSQ